MAGSIGIRAATEHDQDAIAALVESEHLNPFDLDWRRFVVAANRFGLVGAVQLRHHADGSLELGSLVVRGDTRRRGIASRMIDALLARQKARVFMITGEAFAARYERWGFRRIAPADAPASILRNYLLGQAVAVISFVIGRTPKRLVVLDRGVESVRTGSSASDLSGSRVESGPLNPLVLAGARR